VKKNDENIIFNSVVELVVLIDSTCEVNIEYTDAAQVDELSILQAAS